MDAEGQGVQGLRRATWEDDSEAAPRVVGVQERSGQDSLLAACLHVPSGPQSWAPGGAPWQQALGSLERSCALQAPLPTPSFAPLFLLSELKLAFVLFCFNNLNTWHRLYQSLGRQPVVTLSTWLGWWPSCAGGAGAGLGEEACSVVPEA